MTDEKILVNGINALTGRRISPPFDPEEFVPALRGRRRDYRVELDLEWWKERFKKRTVDRRPAADVDPKNLASSGWGVIFGPRISDEIKGALHPLLSLRKKQAGADRKDKGNYFLELDHVEGQSKDDFFREHEVSRGPAHPKELPYYLLLVGGPDEIPTEFQSLLDMQYAVGRLHFDRVEDYASYARHVVAAEAGEVEVGDDMAFFSVQHRGDTATERAYEKLIHPLATKFSGRLVERGKKSDLERLLGGEETPAFLATAAHGLYYRNGHQRQRENQGAILCQDWRGSDFPLESEHYFSAKDVGDEARLRGLIAFLFGCYSAGTPKEDVYPAHPRRGWGNRSHDPRMAPEGFVSALAQRLLSQGALAVLGHVDRTWSRSFGSGYGRGQAHMESFIEALRRGHPVGSAMDFMNEHYAELSTELTHLQDAVERAERSSRSGRGVLRSGTPAKIDQARHFGLWRENNDARNFIILGDPAVRLATQYPLTGVGAEAAARFLRHPWSGGSPTKEEIVEAFLKLGPEDREWVLREVKNKLENQ